MLNCVFRHASNSAWPGSTAKTDIKLFVDPMMKVQNLMLRMANKSENDANCKSVCSISKWVYSFTVMSGNNK